MRIIIVGKTKPEAIRFAKDSLEHIYRGNIKDICDGWGRFEVTFNDDSFMFCASPTSMRGHRADIAFVQNGIEDEDNVLEYLYVWTLCASKLSFMNIQRFD